MIEAAVARSIRHPWLVIVLALIATGVAAWWTATRFAINTDTTRLIASDLPYRQDEIAFAKAFPQTQDLVVAVLDGPTPETTDRASMKLAEALRGRPDMFGDVARPDATPFLARNGLLLQPLDAVRKAAGELTVQAPLLVALARDPSLRGLADALTGLLQGAARQPDAFRNAGPQFEAFSRSLREAINGRSEPISWRDLLSAEPDPGARRAIVLLKPVLDYKSLEPGGAAIRLLRQLAAETGVLAEGVTLRLTGPVPLADQEFATVAENAGLNLSLTLAAVALILFAALRSGRLIAAVLITLLAGLVVTSGIGLALVGELNLISVAFAVLFIGLGVDFGIQVAVRYRAERFGIDHIPEALLRAARGVRLSLTLAAVSLLAGFFSFLPTEFSGVSELGLIAGIGMIVAFVANLTLLPALIAVMGTRPEREAIETASLAEIDHWIARHRRLVIVLTGLLVLAGLPFLLTLPFDSNPMNLRSQSVESVSTFIDLSKTPRTAPNKLDILVPSEADIPAVSAKLAALPEVAGTVSLATFVPSEQEAKLAAIGAARAALAPAFGAPLPPPSDTETIVALRRAAGSLRQAAALSQSAGALGQVLERLADAGPEVREWASQAVFANFPALMQAIGAAVSAEPVTRASLPPDLVADWIAPDGRARIQVSPAGNSNDNAVIARFADAVRSVAPNATGAPIGIIEGGHTIVRAFAEAGLYALVVITIILWVALRRFLDVVLALGPLVLAGILTLEAASLVGLPLNFANIIALPLMFGVGVAFHIYYLIAWRAGITDVLASSLTRAIFFSALTTGVAFGSLYASSHPGTSSMGELLAISLVFTLLAAFIVVPAFLGPPPPVDPKAAARLGYGTSRKG
ncbi:RND transporter [Aureimonas endophytica]|uniref:RND transporter n=1 Tax=Aureimonas endophytica TaxID=2027858 RepID=A0A916ZXD9_9HYPH|nr:MMPL family transporter [Aureimonas endophytica]GGE17850.1 RND transporter [Aureimonas endophytica]